MATRTELQTRLAANGLRRERERFLETTTPEIRGLLADAPFIVPPEPDAIEAIRLFERDGLGHGKKFLPPGYTFREVSFPEDVLTLLSGISDVHDAAPAQLAFDGHLPVFRVGFGRARRLLRELWEVAHGHLFVVTERLDAGFAVDECIGYLEPDPNPSEVFYEVGWWPAQN